MHWSTGRKHEPRAAALAKMPPNFFGVVVTASPRTTVSLSENGWVPGVAAGIIGGAIVGGAIASSPYGPGYYGPGYYHPGYYESGYGYGPCYWRRQRFWDGYGWQVRSIRVCE